MSLIYSLVWIIIFMSGGLWLNNNSWEILSYIAFTFAGLSLLYPLKIFELSKNKNEYAKTFMEEGLIKQVFEFKCQNCQISEPYVDMNTRPSSKLYISEVLYTRNDKSHVRGLLCFSCDYISEYIGGKNLGQIEYLQNYKINVEMKNKFIDFAQSYGHTHALNKIKKINISRRISFVSLLIILTLGYYLVPYLFSI
jgi:hypothetical protein